MMKILKRSIQRLLLISTLAVLLYSCLQGSDNQTEKEKNLAETAEKNNDSAEVISLNSAQYKNAGIQVGMLESKVLSGFLEATGKIDVPPENLISITPLLGGTLKSTPLEQGSSVQQGQVVAVLENPDFIALQEEYLEAESQLRLETKEYQRQQKLAEENINSEKVLEKAKSIYESARIRSNALRQRLELINISPDQIRADHIQRQLSIYAPSSGFITKVNVNKGKYIGPKETMFEMVTNAPLHIDLKVFEQNISLVKEGQQVWFKSAGDTTTRLAVIELIEKGLSGSNTLTVHCVAKEKGLKLMPGAYVQAKIETQPKPVPSLPAKAIVQYEGNNYVFVQMSPEPDATKADHFFKMVPVNIGGKTDDYTEIKAPYEALQDQEIVTKGAYDLLSQLKNEGE